MRKKLSDFEIQPIGDQPEGYYFNGAPYTGTIIWEFDNVVGSEFEVKNGLKEGLQKEFLADGTITRSTNYENGIEHGISNEYFASGKPKEEMYFEKGVLIWSNVYDENGKLVERYDG